MELLPYCSRPITAHSALHVEGFPLLTAGSWPARINMNSTQEKAASALAIIVAETARRPAGCSTSPAAKGITAATASAGEVVPTPEARRQTPSRKAPSPQRLVRLPSVHSKIAAGAATRALMCNGTAKDNRYAVSTSQRDSPERPARSAVYKASQDRSSDAAYTSVSFALSHTVDATPAHIAAANA